MNETAKKIYDLLDKPEDWRFFSNSDYLIVHKSGLELLDDRPIRVIIPRHDGDSDGVRLCLDVGFWDSWRFVKKISKIVRFLKREAFFKKFKEYQDNTKIATEFVKNI